MALAPNPCLYASHRSFHYEAACYAEAFDREPALPFDHVFVAVTRKREDPTARLGGLPIGPKPPVRRMM